MITWKWIQLTCPSCGKAVAPSVGKPNAPDAMVSPYPCWECEHPEEVAEELRKQKESERKIMELAARGEIKDANGNPVPAIRVVQLSNGVFEHYRYAIDPTTDQLIEIPF
jgi:hypothetical protein